MKAGKGYAELLWWIGVALVLIGVFIAIGLGYALFRGKPELFDLYAYSSIGSIVCGIVAAALGRSLRR